MRGSADSAKKTDLKRSPERMASSMTRTLSMAIKPSSVGSPRENALRNDWTVAFELLAILRRRLRSVVGTWVSVRSATLDSTLEKIPAARATGRRRVELRGHL